MAKEKRTAKKKQRGEGGNLSVAELRETGERYGMAREIVGVILIGLAIAISLSLVSYKPGSSGASVNWLGPVGRFLAGNVLEAMGLSAYAVVIAMFISAFLSFGIANSRFKIAEALAFIFLTISGAMLFELVLSGEKILGHPPGGRLGIFLGGLSAHYLSVPGSILVVIVVLLVSLIVTTGLSVGSAIHVLIKSIIFTAKLIGKISVKLFSVAFDLSHKVVEKLTEVIVEKMKERNLKREMEIEKQKKDIEQEFVSINSANLNDPAEAISIGAEEGDKMPVIKFCSEVEPEASISISQREDEEEPLISINSKAEEMQPQEITNEPALMAEGVVSTSKLSGPALGSLASADVRHGEPEVVLPEEETETVSPKVGTTEEEGPIIVEQHKSEHEIYVPDEKRYENFQMPPTDLLVYHGSDDKADEEEYKDEFKKELCENAKLLEEKLTSYGVRGGVKEIRVGPVVTTYEYLPDAGIKSSKVASLSNDLALQMAVERVRIVPNIPGKGVMGIEVPNKHRQVVSFRNIIESKQFAELRKKTPLALAIGKNIEGVPYGTDLRKMPHMLLAGATGTGKSVAINTIVMSLIMRNTPAEVKLIMIDPKMVELSIYNNIPHLLLPVIVDPQKAALALMWAVDEMERRYELLAAAGSRGIENYNKHIDDMKDKRKSELSQEGVIEPEMGKVMEGEIPEKLPYIVLVIDELADLMMVSPKEVETCIARLAQKARAAGIHLILATQRPSTDVLTGMIKANFPARFSCKTASQHDSKTILNTVGAENLLGFGDMLILPPGSADLIRVQGALVDEEEIRLVVDFLKEQGTPSYNEDILKPRAEESENKEDNGDRDTLYQEALRIITEMGEASVSALQRRLRIGYVRASRMVDDMARDGYVGPPNGAQPRQILKLPPM